MKVRINSCLLCLVLLCSMFVLVGCTPPAKATKMIPEKISISKKHTGSLLVTVSGGWEVNKNWSKRISTDMVSNAICDSMENVFDSVHTSGKSDYQVYVTLLEYERSGGWFGIGNETAHVAMKWKLTNMDGKVLWAKTIQTKSSLGMLEEIPQEGRKQRVNEGAIRENINQAIQTISQLSF